jgi:hypothetical protein
MHVHSHNSSKATFDDTSFVCTGANMKDGGGADALVPFARTRVSRVNIAQQILEAHMQPMDEQVTTTAAVVHT